MLSVIEEFLECTKSMSNVAITAGECTRRRGSNVVYAKLSQVKNYAFSRLLPILTSLISRISSLLCCTALLCRLKINEGSGTKIEPNLK